MGQGVRWSTYEPDFGHGGNQFPPESGHRSVGWYLKWLSITTLLVLGVLAASALLTTGQSVYVPPDVPQSELDRIAGIAALLSGLDPVDEYRVEFVSRSEITRLARELPEDPEELAEYEKDLSNFEALVKLLGLMPQDSDLRELFEQAGTGVIGLYDRDTEVIYVATDGPEYTVYAELTLVHEFVHRLQDAQYDLEALDEDTGSDSEAKAALKALVEGHADWVEAEYFRKNLTQQQRDAYRASFDRLGFSGALGTPDVLGRVSIWPYVAGEEFIDNVTFAGFDAHRIYRSPPETTEQIIGRYKYGDNDVTLGGPAPEGLSLTVGDGWTISDEGVLGAAFITNWLASIVTIEEIAADETLRWTADLVALNHVVTDWARDDYLILEKANGEQALAAIIQWDERSDVGEFQTHVTLRYGKSGAYERLETTESTFELWTGPQGIVGFVDVRERPEATFMAVASTVWQVDQFLQLMTSGSVASVDAGRAERASVLVLPTARPRPTATPTPTRTPEPLTPKPAPTARPVTLPTPTTVSELLPVDESASITGIVTRLKLLGMISPEEDDQGAEFIAKQNRPLLPHTAPMSFPHALESQLGEGWSIRTRGEAGVNFIERWLWSLGSDQGANSGAHRDAAQGWVTDAYLLLKGPASQKGLVWRIEWHNPDWDKDQDVLSAIRLRRQEAAEFSETLHRTLDQSTIFQRLESEIPGQSLWRGPGGVLGFRNDNVLDWTSIVVFEDVELVITALYELSYI